MDKGSFATNILQADRHLVNSIYCPLHDINRPNNISNNNKKNTVN